MKKILFAEVYNNGCNSVNFVIFSPVLRYLGENTKGRVREIYQGASSNIDEPKNLEKIIKSINELVFCNFRLCQD